MASSSQKDLFTSVISEIKSYTGDDPLRPWVRGIRKIHQSLPPHVLKEKLPRFLQKCAQTFESYRRYRNDSRYIAIWIQLMDYVEDARVILRKMEKNQIGVKRAKFYIAYALYYEKKKRYEDAEKMYHLGVQKLAEPMGELQKSYDQFLQRMKLLKQRRTRDTMQNIRGTALEGHNKKTAVSIGLKDHQNDENFFQNDSMEENSCCEMVQSHARPESLPVNDVYKSAKSAPLCRDDVRWSQADDACHNDQSDPTINTKEAIDAISNMFKKAMVSETMSRSSNQVKQKPNQHESTIEVFVDGRTEQSGNCNRSICDAQAVSAKLASPDFPKKNGNSELQKPFVCTFKILADDEDEEANEDEAPEDCMEMEEPVEGSRETRIDSLDVRLNEDTVFRRLKEDTVIRKIVGSTVFDEPKVENAYHHGLVDPTVNLKQAIDDINVMFGKPLNFLKAGKPEKQEKKYNRKSESGKQAFFILADDNMEKDLNGQAPPCISHSSNEKIDLFEPTLFTKEAMNEINGLFGKPLDF